jgi:hypothetical protein
MAFEYESLVGHLYIVGGRSISMPPPGALCEVAPTRATRGREADTFFALVTPHGKSVAAATFYERLTALATERYFTSSGSVTAGLRDLFQHVNQNLFEYNQKNEKKYQASLICGVLRGSDMIVGQMGPTVAIIRQNGRTRTFPEDLTTLHQMSLGIAAEPDVKLTQFRVNVGTRLVLGDAHLAAFPLNDIENAIVSMDVATALVAFKEIAKLQLMLMLVEFVLPDEALTDDIPAAESTAQITQPSREPVVKAQPDSIAKANQQARERRPGPLDVIWRHFKRALGRMTLSLGRVFGVFNRMINHYFGTDDEEQSGWLRSPIGLGAVIALPVIVVTLVIVLWLSGTDESQFEICLQELDEFVVTARSPQVVNSDRQTILNAWDVVLRKVNECETLRPDDPQLTSIRAEARSITDAYDQVTRIEPIVIDSIPGGARLTRIIAQEQNLFVLDSVNNFVYQIILSDDGLSAAQRALAIPNIQLGAVVNNVQVGELIDIAINPFNDNLVALDRNGGLIQCEIRFLECRGERIIDQDRWGEPIAMAIWQGNGTLYLLDAEAQNGQVWRYQQAGGSFATGAGEYFGGATKPTLRGPVDLEITGRGEVYILQADGTITSYFDGEREEFGYTSFPEGQAINNAQSMYLNETVTSLNLLIVSQNVRTLYETSLIGNFNASYRPFDETLFDLIEDVVVVSDQNRREIMYVISGNTVFALPKGN